ncbi:MAG: T9SS type A sorting domain-containing protein [Ginsengibacter sp.]
MPETPCTGNFCDIVDNVLGNYNITWQAPSGWAQTSLTNNGSNVSFTPDATTSGNIIATIHLSCGYTETRTLSVSRGVEAPAFTASTFQGCNGSSTNISINPTCGAANYTYTIVGNSGVKFTSNNLQILTTTNTTVSVSMSGGSSVNSLKTKANYPNSVSSTESTSTLNVNSTKPSISATYTDYKGSHPVQYWVGNYNSVCNSYMAEIVVSTPGASSTVWSKVTSNPSDITWYPNFSGNGNLDFYFWSVNQTAVFQINAINGCGTTSNAFGFKSVDCTGGGCLQYSISPNPAKGTLNIEPNIPAPCGPLPTLTTSDISKTSSITSGTKRSITQVDIYDNYGNLKKSQVENKTQHVTIDLTGFKTGVYLVIISDGTHKERQQIIIQ